MTAHTLTHSPLCGMPAAGRDSLPRRPRLVRQVVD